MFISLTLLGAIFLIYNLVQSDIYQCLEFPMSTINITNKFLNKLRAGDHGRSDVTGVLNDGAAFDDLDPHIPFNINRNSDVIVVLHVQKTGGTQFGKHLVNDLEYPCICNETDIKRCYCFRPNDSGSVWLFSKFSTGWLCGVHADWTALNACVERMMHKYEHDNDKKYR